MSGYLIEPIGDNEDFQGAFRNVQKGQKQPNLWFSKETAVLTHFFQGYGRDSSCSGLLTCQGTLWNQSETMKTFQDPSGTSKRTKNSQIVDFQRRWQSWYIFFQGYGRDSSCHWLLTCQGTLWNHLETLKTSKELSGTSITATKSQNGKQGVFKGDGNLDALFSR